jgi:hypothetical protein
MFWRYGVTVCHAAIVVNTEIKEASLLKMRKVGVLLWKIVIFVFSNQKMIEIGSGLLQDYTIEKPTSPNKYTNPG